jgi:hypothetical protein
MRVMALGIQQHRQWPGRQQHNPQRVLERSFPQERSGRACIGVQNGHIVKRLLTNLYIIALAIGEGITD